MVHVFVPHEIIDGREASPEYDTPGFRAQLRRWFEALELDWEWRPTTIANARERVAAVRSLPVRSAAVLNLCDGTEVDGYPGLTVIQALEEAGVAFTGAGSRFYASTNDKVRVKDTLEENGVETPAFARIVEPERDVPAAATRIGYPLIVKPVFSAACFGISQRSVVHDAAGALAQVARLRAGLHGFRFPELYVERFVVGREFTVLVRGAADWDAGIHVLPPVERVFHESIPPELRFLTFERYWEQYDEETPLAGNAPLYHYEPVASGLSRRLRETCRGAYLALGGTGYARIDLRLDAATDALHVIEVNANCGLSDDGQTSVSWILRLAEIPFADFLRGLLADAAGRYRASS